MGGGGCALLLVAHLCGLSVGKFIKGIFQPFELGGMTRLIRSAVKFWKAGNLKNFF
jgi:hypothetical protein